MGLLSAGSKLLGAAAGATFEHPLKLLTPGTPQRVFDEDLEDYVDSAGEPVLELAVLGSLQPVIRNVSRPDVAEIALVQEEQATFRAYLPNTPQVRAACTRRDLYLVDAEESSPTYNSAFRLLKPPVAMGDLGSFRLELKEL